MALVIALLASIFAVAAPAGAQAVTVTRTAGADRYATAAQVALAAFPAGQRPVANVILASGENFPDGLAAASIAGGASAPILLTAQASLPAATLTALVQLQPTTVHVVGGQAAIGAGVRAQLRDLGYALNELSGPNRYATAARISQFLRQNVAPIGTFQGQRTAIIATGENFPDALAGGAPAAAGRHPILLTPTAALAAETRTELQAAAIQRVIILGGTAAVSQAVQNEIQALGIAVTRISGPDRQATAVALAGALVTPAPAGFTFSTTGAVLVSGGNFPDALTAAAWAGRQSPPQAILLTGPSPATGQFLATPPMALATLRVIGGTAAVSDAEVNAIVAAITAGRPVVQVAAFAGATGLRLTFDRNVTNNGSVAVTGLAAVTCPTNCELLADQRTIIVTVPGTLQAGALVLVSGFQTTPPNPQTIVPTTATVAADAAGTANVVNAVAGASTFIVEFSRSVTAAPTVTVAGAAAPVTALNAPFNTRFQVTPAAALTSGQTITVSGATTTGTTAIPTITRTVGVDLAPPLVTAATVAVTGVQGSVNLTADATTNVIVAARAIGPESANLQVQTVNAPAGVSIPTSAAVTAPSPGVTLITVTLGRNAAGAINATPAMVAAAIANNPTANNLVQATAQTPGSTAVVPEVAAIPLSAGTRLANVTVTFNEAIRALDGTVQIGLDLNGNGFADVTAFTELSTAQDRATGLLRVQFTLGANQTVTGLSQIRISGVQDVAGNVMTPTVRTLTAA
jgi:putative cell wall-binding protein